MASGPGSRRICPVLPAGQRGVALLMAVIIAALVTILSVDLAWSLMLDARRTAAMLHQQHAMMSALGAESWALMILDDDLNESESDHPTEDWATPLPPLPIGDGERVEGYVEGYIEDMQGRFNLNNLIDSNGRSDGEARAHFERLLALLELDPRLAQRMTDWIDADIEPVFPDGAEDGFYLSVTPPYRPPNGPITSTSELLALPEMTAEAYRALRPYVAALPVGTRLNTCTASCMVLNSLDPEGASLCSDGEALVEDRADECYPNIEDLQNLLPPQSYALLSQRVADSSQYFRVVARVSIGTSQFTLYSLLERDGSTRPILRSIGTE